MESREGEVGSDRGVSKRAFRPHRDESTTEDLILHTTEDLNLHITPEGVQRSVAMNATHNAVTGGK